MRVLMLGWEFPPHISGGLGTACLGLTRGLAHHDVDVTFVVPRTHGDEDAPHLDLIGCNGLERLRRQRASGGSATATALAETHVGSDDASDDAHVSVVGIESLLRPYLTETAYATLQEERGERRGMAANPPSTLPENTAAWAERVAAVVEAAESAAAAPDGAAFTGSYGPGLFDEVVRYAAAVADLARSETFDLVHAHDWMTFAAGAAAARIAGVPLVVHVHASEYDRSGEKPNPRVRDLELFGLSVADRIVAVSHFTAGVLKRHFDVDANRLRVVHNAVTQAEQQHEAWPARTIEDPIVLFLGRVTFQKGPDYFLEAARRVADVRPDVKFVISGSGDMLPGLIENAASLGLARNVHFTGFLRGKDVERMYAMADVYVMPSVSEPFGISPLEAMNLDVPVIVSRTSGVSEILRHALKVDFWDVDELANKILAILAYPALREELVVQGRDEVRRMHWNASAGLLKNVYAELLT